MRRFLYYAFLKDVVMRRIVLFVLLCLTHTLLAVSKSQNIHISVIIASYNNELWYLDNLNSIAAQKYPDWHAYYINDCSSDATGSLVEKFIKDRQLEKSFTIVHNADRRGALANIYDTIHKLDPNSVVVIVDGDD